jgi:hypothetical protein
LPARFMLVGRLNQPGSNRWNAPHDSLDSLNRPTADIPASGTIAVYFYDHGLNRPEVTGTISDRALYYFAGHGSPCIASLHADTCLGPLSSAEDGGAARHLQEADATLTIPSSFEVDESRTMVLRLDKRRRPLNLPAAMFVPASAQPRRVQAGNFASARLVADRRDFEIQPVNAQRQPVWDDDTTDFYFIVTALRSGHRNLKIVLGVALKRDDDFREKLIADRNVEVFPNYPKQSVYLLRDWWFLWMALVPSAVAVFKWLRKKGGKAGFDPCDRSFGHGLSFSGRGS